MWEWLDTGNHGRSVKRGEDGNASSQHWHRWLREHRETRGPDYVDLTRRTTLEDLRSILDLPPAAPKY